MYRPIRHKDEGKVTLDGCGAIEEALSATHVHTDRRCVYWEDLPVHGGQGVGCSVPGSAERR